jgi:hypothetical protein
MSDETRWYLRPLRPVLRDWKKPIHEAVAKADRGAHTSLQLLLDRPIAEAKPPGRAADFDAIARALEPRITELQRRRMEGEK